MNRKYLTILSIFLALVFLQATPVNAHSPGPINLDYDFGTQVLTVQVTHSVTDVVSHRIAQIVVEKNSVQVISRDYTTQDTASGMSDTFSVSTVHGDVLRVTAICSISGQIIGSITVSDPSVTPTTTTTPTPPAGLDSTVVILAVVIGVGIIFIAVAAARRR